MKLKLSWIFLALLLIFNIVRVLPLVTGGLPPGGDSPSHMMLILSTEQAMKDGVWWSDYYNAGYPLFFYYNPLPFFVLALVHMALGMSVISLYKFVLALFYALIPFAFYFASRWMKLSETTALFAALASTIFSTFINFGIESFAFFGFGLFSELWAAIIAPFAIAAAYRAVHMKKSIFVASLLLVVLFMTHVLTGYMIALLTIPLLSFDMSWKKFSRYALVGLGMLIGVSFLLLPALLYKDYYGGMPFDSAEKVNGYGVGILQKTFTGRLLDNDRLPLLSILALFGVVAGIRSKGISRYFLICFVLVLLFLMGRTTFGSAFNLIPGIKDVQLFRFVMAADIIAAFLIGLGADWLVNLAKNKYKINMFYATIVIVILLLPAFVHSYKYMNGLIPFKTLDAEPGVAGLLEAIKNTGDGRIDARKENFISYAMPVVALPLFTGKSMALSDAGGVHDSLSYYYLNFVQKTEEHMWLFNVNYVLVTDKIDSKTGTNLLAKTTANSSYFDIVHADIAVDAKNKEARNVIVAWMYSKLVAEREFLIVDSKDAKKVIELNVNSTWVPSQDFGGKVKVDPAAWPVEITSEGNSTSMPALIYFTSYSSNKKSCGYHHDEIVEHGHYGSVFDVADSGCYALLKVSASPEWHAYVDGVENPVVQLSPSFMGVKLEKGTHTVDFRYSLMPLRIWLLLFSFAGLLMFWYLDRRFFAKL